LNLDTHQSTTRSPGGKSDIRRGVGALNRREFYLQGDKSNEAQSGMPQAKAHEYRRWAEKCLSRAAKAKRDGDKMAWLGLAKKWQQLAEEVGNNRVAQQAQQPQSERES
jgi:hypothetical protein